MADDFAHRREFKTEDLVEEDRPVKVGFREAVRLRIEFLFVFLGFELERIKFGVEVTTNAIRTDQHQRVNRVRASPA